MSNFLEFELADKMGYRSITSQFSSIQTGDGYLDLVKIIEMLSHTEKGVVRYQSSDFMLYNSFGVVSSLGIHHDVKPQIEINGKKRFLDINVEASSINGTINLGAPYTISLDINSINRTAVYKILIPFNSIDSPTNQGIVDIINDVAAKRFRDPRVINEEYALVFSSASFSDWIYIIDQLKHRGDVETENYVFYLFKKELKEAGEDKNKLEFVYEKAPHWVIAKFGREKVFSDMKLILYGSVDENRTNAVLKMLRSFVTPPFINYGYHLDAPFRESLKEDLAVFEGSILPDNMNFLLDNSILHIINKSEATVFEQLYTKFFDSGSENDFNEFLQLFYLFWLNSDYPTLKYQNNYNDKANRQGNEDVAPDIIILDYQSKKILGFYDTNHDFEFKKQNLIVREEKVVGTHYGKDGIPSKIYDMVNRGKIHLFQPINVPSLVQDGELKLPDNVVPAFFLKAIDDKNYWDDFDKVVWLSIEVITTFLGVGYLAKLRHLSQFIGAATKLPIILTQLQITSGILNTMLLLVNDCKDGTFCNKLRTFLIFLDFATLGVNVLTAKHLSKAAKNALDAMPSAMRKKYPEIELSLKRVAVSSNIARGRNLGQVLESADLLKIENYLTKAGVKLQMVPSSGEHVIVGYFNKSGRPTVINENSAGVFITDGKKMTMVLRENGTLMVFIHELMHLRHCQSLGKKKYYLLSTVEREKYVFDKLVQHSKFLTRGELKEALEYVRSNYKFFGVTDQLGNSIILDFPHRFDLSKIQVQRQSASIKKILTLK